MAKYVMVNDRYGDTMSDRQIAERCGLTELLQVGDSTMVDKGFDV